MRASLWDARLDADRGEPDEAVDALLVGAIDPHVHAAPSPYPRRVSIADAAADAASAGFGAIVVKSHHHSMQTDVLALRAVDALPIDVHAGIALNEHVGGLNPAAVELTLGLGGRVVWFPTISSQAHIDFHSAHDMTGFPTATVRLRPVQPISILAADGGVKPEVRDILHLIAEHDAVMASGHLDADQLDVLIGAARDAGVRRIVVNHPIFIVGASPERTAEWARAGVYIEHSVVMFESATTEPFPLEQLIAYIEAAGVGRTVLGSDLGQEDNPLPVTGYRRLLRRLLDAGLAPDDLSSMVRANPRELLFT